MTGLELLAGVAIWEYLCSPKEGYADEKARASDEAAEDTAKAAARALKKKSYDAEQAWHSRPKTHYTISIHAPPAYMRRRPALTPR